jgi:tRNA A37 threonylcarbamoyladenosine biosynthesis protein TsaE
MRADQFVDHLQTYTTLLVAVKSRLWRMAARDGDEDAQHAMVDFPLLLNLDLKRWNSWNTAKREQTILRYLAEQKNPYEQLRSAPTLFRSAQARFRLSDDELRILMFLTITRSNYALASVFADNWDNKQLLLFQDLSHLFNLSLAQVNRALSRTGILRKSGLVVEARFFAGTLDLMDGLVAAIIEQPDQSIDLLLRNLYHRCRDSDFAVEDFQHVAHHIDAILRILQQDKGNANVLIYGPPGTGKTELAKAINMRLDTVLYRLNPLTHDADDSSPMHRIDAFYQLQAVVKQHADAAILFDEVEEIFALNEAGHAGPLKSFLTDLLETNAVPTLWVCNSVDQFDHAIIRRFDYVLHLDYPDYAAKRAYLNKQDLNAWLSRSVLDSVAQHEKVSFGQLAQAIRLIKTAEAGAFHNNDRQFLAMINEYLRAVGHPLLTESSGTMIERQYMPGLYNCSVPLARVVDVFQQCGFGRVLFQGEVGTGKSTAARHIAEGCGLTVKTVSETELLTLSELYGLLVVDTLFSELVPNEDILVLEDFNQCLSPKPWQSGSLVEAVSTRLKTLLRQFQGFAIVIVEGYQLCDTELFDVAVTFRRLHPKQLSALEQYRQGDLQALDGLDPSLSDGVVDFNGTERTLETDISLAEFHQELRESRVRDALTGYDSNQPKRSKERLSVVPKVTSAETQ